MSMLLKVTGNLVSACIYALIFRAKIINPDWIALHTSRGYESQAHKLFMRATGKRAIGTECKIGLKIFFNKLVKGFMIVTTYFKTVQL